MMLEVEAYCSQCLVLRDSIWSIEMKTNAFASLSLCVCVWPQVGCSSHRLTKCTNICAQCCDLLVDSGDSFQLRTVRSDHLHLLLYVALFEVLLRSEIHSFQDMTQLQAINTFN